MHAVAHGIVRPRTACVQCATSYVAYFKAKVEIQRGEPEFLCCVLHTSVFITGATR